MKIKHLYVLISLLLLSESVQIPAADDLSDASTGSFSTDQSQNKVSKPQLQEDKPEKQNDEYNSFGENLYNQNVDTSPYEIEKKEKRKIKR